MVATISMDPRAARVAGVGVGVVAFGLALARLLVDRASDAVLPLLAAAGVGIGTWSLALLGRRLETARRRWRTTGGRETLEPRIQ